MTTSAIAKRPRRTPEQMTYLRVELAKLAREHAPVTCRQLFYLAVCAHLIEKTQNNYKNVVIRLCLLMRQEGEIAWEYVSDETRFYFKPTTYDSTKDALREAARLYRKSLWATSPVNCQVWCESLSVAGVIKSVTDEWDVPLYPGKGYSSHDFLRNAGRDIAHRGKPTVIYLLGDYDPSGRDIIRFVRKMLREYADEVNPGVRIDFRDVAVTQRQIVEWDLPSNPAKTTDSRQRRSGIDQAVEIEAILPTRLRELTGGLIESLLDPGEVERLKAVEVAERDTLRRIALVRGN